MLSVFCRLQELKKMHTSRQILNLRQKSLLWELSFPLSHLSSSQPVYCQEATSCVGLATISAMFIKCQRLPLRHCSDVWLLAHNDFEARLEEAPPAGRTVLGSIIKHDQNSIIKQKPPAGRTVFKQQTANSDKHSRQRLYFYDHLNLQLSTVYINICCFTLFE